MKLVNPLSIRQNMTPRRLNIHEQDRAYARLYAKELVVHLDLLDVCSGAALKWLLCEPYVDLELPMACSVKFYFFLPRTLAELEASNITSPDTKPNIGAFAQQVRQVAPMAKEIGISLAVGCPDDITLPTELLSSLVLQLSQHAVDIKYNFNIQPAIVDQQISGLRSLTCCSADTTDDGEQIVRLARNNAATLRVLEISVRTTTDMTGLIRYSDGSYVQYPCLQTLRLSDRPRVDAPCRPVFPGAVPFPSLRRLALGARFYFDDDTVFRGNDATLESVFGSQP
ncbi:hypothetical protein IWW37_002463 [Coemansia sp. RSA 2050]|nr:hypothetical protein IWW37_002463 [Coemansia sp. RSA 2050]